MFFVVVTVLPTLGACLFYRLSGLKKIRYLPITILLCVVFANICTIGITLLLPQRNFSFLLYKLQHPVSFFFFTIKYCVIQGGFSLFPSLYITGYRLYIKKMHKIRLWQIMYLLFFVFLFFGTAWAIRFFPMGSPAVVIAVLTGGLNGFSPDILLSALQFVVLPCLVFGLLYVFICKRFAHNQHVKYSLLLLTLFFSACSLYYFYVKIPIHDYIYWYRFANSADKVDSEFYTKNYTVPDLISINFPPKKRNLILIFAESLETGFADTANGGYFAESLIPSLTQLAANQVNFSHTDGFGGGREAAGTGQTIAGMVGNLFGIPYILPAGIDQNYTDIETFLPGAISLTDILSQAGYAQRFLCGSDKNFAGRGALFETHGGVEVHDIAWYKKNKKLPESYSVFWGFEDTMLYEFARQELEELSLVAAPFMLSFLTVDTHAPIGYVCSVCKNEFGNSTQGRFKDVVRCADRQLAAFIDYCIAQDWYKDTAIVIVADHLLHTPVTLDVGFGLSERRLLNIFINAAIQPIREKNRNFTPFDVFPSILESLGVLIDGHALGFGRSLFSEEPTLSEIYGHEKLNGELMRKTTNYAAFYQEQYADF